MASTKRKISYEEAAELARVMVGDGDTEPHFTSINHPRMGKCHMVSFHVYVPVTDEVVKTEFPIKEAV